MREHVQEIAAQRDKLRRELDGQTVDHEEALRVAREALRELAEERDALAMQLRRVTAQRDELRRVIGDVRRYAREEANRVTKDAVQTMIQTVRGQESGRTRAFDPEMQAYTGSVLPSGSGPIHMAAHLEDPGDPSHTGTMGPTD